MANITYNLGGTSFDAVPERMDRILDLPVASEATLGRAMVHVVGIGRETIVLTGKYMSANVRSAIETLYEACEETGATAVFNDGVTDRNVLIRKFEAVPIVGKTEGFGFRIELIVIG
jgi:2-methylisocitrate lyase-like PEP mutase family enzyme